MSTRQRLAAGAISISRCPERHTCPTDSVELCGFAETRTVTSDQEIVLFFGGCQPVVCKITRKVMNGF